MSIESSTTFGSGAGVRRGTSTTGSANSALEPRGEAFRTRVEKRSRTARPAKASSGTRSSRHPPETSVNSVRKISCSRSPSRSATRASTIVPARMAGARTPTAKLSTPPSGTTNGRVSRSRLSGAGAAYTFTIVTGSVFSVGATRSRGVGSRARSTGSHHAVVDPRPSVTDRSMTTGPQVRMAGVMPSTRYPRRPFSPSSRASAGPTAGAISTRRVSRSRMTSASCTVPGVSADGTRSPTRMATARDVEVRGV